jgi:hypothetical protein
MNITPRADGLPAVVEAVTRLHEAAEGGDDRAVADCRFALQLLLGHDPDGLGRCLRDSDLDLPDPLRVALGELWAALAMDNLFDPANRGRLLAFLDGMIAVLSADHEPAPFVNARDVALLKALAKCRPYLMKLDDILAAASPPLSRPTACVRLRRLVGLGLATRPDGEHGGAGITPSGVALLKALGHDVP